MRNDERFLSDRMRRFEENEDWVLFKCLLAEEKTLVDELEFKTPIHAADEGIRAIREGQTYYSPSFGLAKLRREIASYYKRRFGVTQYKEENVMVTVGVSEGIDLLCRSLLNPGDEVLVVDPCSVSYVPLIELSGASVKYVASNEDFVIDEIALEQAISEKTKMLILNYPNNPTGAIMGYEAYEKLVPLILKHHLLVVSDESYLEFTYGSKPVSLGLFESLKEQLVVLNGFSKAYAMSGWRIGYALGPSWILEGMKRIHQYGTMCPTTPSQFAAIEACSVYGDREIEEKRSKLLIRRNHVRKRLNKMGISVPVASGAYYMFINVSPFGMDGFMFAKRLLEEQGVVVIPGSVFGKSCKDYVRLSYASKQVDVVLDGIEEFLKTVDKASDNC